MCVRFTRGSPNLPAQAASSLHLLSFSLVLWFAMLRLISQYYPSPGLGLRTSSTSSDGGTSELLPKTLFGCDTAQSKVSKAETQVGSRHTTDGS